MKKFFLFCIIVAMVCTLTKLSAQVNLTNGLIAWYPLNGNANDSSGNGRNGIVNNAKPAHDRFGKSHGAYYCDGTKKAITVLAFNDYNAKGATLSIWIKTKKNASALQVITGAVGSLYLNVHKIGTFLGDFDGELTHLTGASASDSVVTNGKWVNITATNDGTNTKLYWNGILQKSYPEKLSVGVSNLIIANKGYVGSIDDVRIYNRAISADEAAAIYNLTY